MKYINVKTGAVVHSSSIVTGENWEKEEKKSVKKKETRKAKE